MQGELPIIDYSSGAAARPEAIFRCATDSIKWIEGDQFQEQEAMHPGGQYRQPRLAIT
jgi:hypothetical protein